MTSVETLIDDAVKHKVSTGFREEMYHKIRAAEKKEKGTNLLIDNHVLYNTAFAIGYHFNEQKDPGTTAFINVNVMDREIKDLMVRLILKRKPELDAWKDVWGEIEKYAEGGIQILYDNWKERKMADIAEILE